MPPGKTRPKDDTWTTEELSHALKGAKDGDRKKRSRDDEDGKERRRAKDDMNGDDGRRRHKDDEKKSRKRDEEDNRGRDRKHRDSSPSRVELTEEDRERLRQERREKRGGDAKKKEDRVRKEEKVVDSDEDGKRRSKREDSARRHRQRDDEEDRDRRRRHGDDDGDRKRHRDKESRHRDRDEDTAKKEEDEDDRERRRQERRERKEKEKRDEDEEKDRDRDRDRKHRSKRDRDEDEEREKRHRDREERHKDREKDRDRERGKDREERHREREERKRREREEEERRRREEEERKKKEEEAAGDADDYNDYDDDDFEDYEDDFEDDEELNEGGRRRQKEGEMEEVLRALDEENARLTSLSHRSNWSDSTELSDERFKEGDGLPTHPGGGENKPARPRTFINFVSAKQRVMNQSMASKARRRADDLKNMIELDTVYYDLFDLPPVREYELYIRSFGRSNTKQAYVQTNEDAVERDVQTEETEELDKWTQHPAEDLLGVGGDGISVISASEEKKSAGSDSESLARVGKFLERAAQVMLVILEEEKTTEDGAGQARDRTSNIAISDGFSQLSCPSYLTGRHVEKVCFCPMQPNTFLTLHSKLQEGVEGNVLSSYGIICVWSAKETASPQKVLTCLGQPTCACFSPSRAVVVIAGMRDGSVTLWDLREPSSLHRSVDVCDQQITIRFPTYNTAGVLEKENHHSPVTSITAVHPKVIRSESDDSQSVETEAGLSFQLASVEENATVNLWVVTEIPTPDMAGSEVDLGLAPGGRVKLLRSSAIVLENPNKLVRSNTLKALDIKLSPSDLNHFFVATDLGQVIHGVRFGSRVFPRAFQPEVDSPRLVTCLDFSPFGEPYFLAGCEDGCVQLYHTSQKHPLASWPTCESHSVLTVQWSRSRPVVFFVLSENSTLYTYDLVETGLQPVRVDQISSGRATALAVASDPALIGGNKSLPAQLMLALDNGTAEIHTISSSLRKQQPLEAEFLAHYTDRF